MGWTPNMEQGLQLPSHCSHPNGTLIPGAAGFTSEKPKLGEGLDLCGRDGSWDTGAERDGHSTAECPISCRTHPKHSLGSSITCTCFPPRCSKDNNLH